MEKDSKLIVMGQDVAEYGGVFKVTDGFVADFGKDRVRNTPLCESAIIGTGMGLAIRGRSSVIEMQFADFVSCGYNQIVNNLAKSNYRWGQPAPVVVRMPTGAGVGAGPFHSQSNEAWFAKVPGLKVVYPSTPYDAKGLLTTSILDPNPVIFFEHKHLYRSVNGPVPEAYYNLPLGKAAIVREGDEVTIVTYGWGVHKAMEMAELIGCSADIIDLRTLIPWDEEAVLASVSKTGKCIVLQEDTATLGMAAEIAATISEKAFQSLDAPVVRVGSLDTPVPYNKKLDDNFLPWERFKEKLEWLLNY
jgi:2-oxoisovalerate dehydrogenase E1 component